MAVSIYFYFAFLCLSAVRAADPKQHQWIQGTCIPQVAVSGYVPTTTGLFSRTYKVSPGATFQLDCSCHDWSAENLTLYDQSHRPIPTTPLHGYKIHGVSAPIANLKVSSHFVCMAFHYSTSVHVIVDPNAKPQPPIRPTTKPIIQSLEVTSQTPRFVKHVGQTVSCKAVDVSPSPSLYFTIQYANGTVERIPNEEVLVKSEIGLNPRYPQGLTTIASFQFNPDQEHEDSRIVCAASGTPLIASLKVKVFEGRPPVVTRFYTEPEKPIEGQRFSFYCLVDTDGPLWDVKAVRIGDNQTFPVISNQHIMLRAWDEQIGSRLAARRDMSGIYRCNTWSIFGFAPDVTLTLLVL